MRFNEIEIEEALEFLQSYIYIRESIERLNLDINAGECINQCRETLFPNMEEGYDQEVKMLYFTVMKACCENMKYQTMTLDDHSLYDRFDLLKSCIANFMKRKDIGNYIKDVTEEEAEFIDKILKSDSLDDSVNDLCASEVKKLYDVALNFYDYHECALIKIESNIREASIIVSTLPEDLIELSTEISNGVVTTYLLSTNSMFLYSEVPLKETLEKLYNKERIIYGEDNFGI